MRAAGNVNCIYSITLQFYQAISRQYRVLCNLFRNTDENVDNVQNAGHQFRSVYGKSRNAVEPNLVLSHSVNKLLILPTRKRYMKLEKNYLLTLKREKKIWQIVKR